MIANQIRAVVICLFSRNGTILVHEWVDSLKNQPFYRPLGGGINFGESSQVALRREIREELAAEIAELRYLGTLENIFVYQGQSGHEIVFVYDAVFVDKTLYEQPHLIGCEDSGAPFQVVWKSLTDLHQGSTPIYPTGLLELLQQHGYF